MAEAAAVFFDVDFTLIHPGPRFQGQGYQESCARHGVTVDPARFEQAVRGAAAVLESADELYDAELFISYAKRIIELMGGQSSAMDAVARELYTDWAEHHHFSLYDDVRDSLQTLVARGLRLGLISNSHRCLASFQSHFELEGLITAAVSSSEHGFMKPHPAIFHAALAMMKVAPSQAVMVGDSVSHDVIGAQQVGMHAVLLVRGSGPADLSADVPVIRTLRQLAEAIDQMAVPAR